MDEENNEVVVLVMTSKHVFYHLPHNKLDRKGFLIEFDTAF